MSILPAFLDPHAVPEPEACHACGDFIDGPKALAEPCPHRPVVTSEDLRCTRCCDCDECACKFDDPYGPARWAAPA